MKLQPESKHEMKRMTAGVALCTAIMFVLFAALRMVNLAPFDYRVILGGLCGSAVALANFYGICVMTQKALAQTDEKKRRMQIQLSYNRRMLLQAAWIVVAIVVPSFQAVASIAPLLFPRMTIYYLQITGKFHKDQPKGEDVSVDESVEPVGELVGTADDEGGESEE